MQIVELYNYKKSRSMNSYVHLQRRADTSLCRSANQLALSAMNYLRRSAILSTSRTTHTTVKILPQLKQICWSSPIEWTVSTPAPFLDRTDRWQPLWRTRIVHLKIYQNKCQVRSNINLAVTGRSAFVSNVDTILQSSNICRVLFDQHQHFNGHCQFSIHQLK